MPDYAPSLVTAAAALIAAVLALPGLKLARFSVVMLGLGSGQIYMAAAALGLLLLVENRWRLSLYGQGRLLIALVFLLAAIVGLTALSPTTLRTYSELAQLVVYIVLFILLISFIKSGEDITLILQACLFGSLAVVAAGYLAIELGLQSAPEIFVGRGSNEGAVFVALMGVVPACILFVRSRNPLNLVAALLMTLAQYQATSRGSLVVSSTALLCATFFVIRNQFLRLLVVVAGVGILFTNVPVLMQVYQGQLNFSARERLVLVQYGWDLFRERFWTGWGWGSTNTLAAAAPTVNAGYPHFHNGYVQLLVELGVFGWLIIGGFAYFVISRLLTVGIRLRRPQISAMIAIIGLAISVSFMFDAMLFGADRVIQVVILMALMVRTIALAQANWQGQNTASFTPITAGLAKA